MALVQLIMKRYFILYLSAFILLFLVSCKQKKQSDNWDDTLNSGVVRVACDWNFQSMMDVQVQSFGFHSHFQAVVLPVYGNEKEAIRLLIEDSVRLAVVSRDLNQAEKAEMEAKNMYPKKYLIAFDGIAFITNAVNTDSLMTVSTLKKILTGEFTEWSQINPKTSLGTIRVLFDNKDSGVIRYVVDSITETGDVSKNLYAMNSPLELMEKVVEMPNTIGIIGASILSNEAAYGLRELRKNVRTVRVSRDEHPTVENSYLPLAGDIIKENYPFWRPIYALLSDPRSGLSSGFTIFLSQEVGQLVMLKSGLLPISDPHVMKVRIIDGFPDENTRSRTIN